ncbi:MAG: 30S ribosomal protein S2 [candidate division Zixibacteria bacterium]|nr:30S ribosomal protein S2 [candidate division Zixibacteria bacterium]
MSVTIKDLLEAGVHFGHQTRRWNPKMKKFIFTARSGIYIIDLQKTLQCLQTACQKAKEVTSKRLPILFVGTKKQAKQVIREEAGRCEAFYVSERWLGGMLTNYHTIRNSIKRLKDLERMKEDGTFSKLPKKEVLQLEKEITKLNKMLGGIKEMGRLPGLLYVVDSKKEKIAVAEANKLKIPVVAVIDTNSDPDVIDFPIAGNDDSVKSIKVITSEISNCILEEKKKLVEVELKEEAQKEKLKKSGKEGDGN